MAPYQHEINFFRKKYSTNQINLATLYPNKYQAGIESLAIQILYMYFNNEADFFCERVYFSHKPKSIETGRNLKDFDVIAVTFQYEVDYLNFIDILLKSEIKPLTKERNKKPLIIAGGPCVTENPVPLIPFIDVFVIGELESIFNNLVSAIRSFKITNSLDGFLEINGVFVPELMERKEITKNYVKDLNIIPYPIKQVLPVIDEEDKKHPIAFGSGFLMEISRGCYRNCNFCLIGCQNLPYRERSIDLIENLILEGIELNQRKRVSFIGSAFSDYSKLHYLLEFIVDSGFFPVIPSLRADKIDNEIVALLSQAGEKTITLAPETASDRLHTLINKNLNSKQIIDAADAIIKNGVDKLKLYFIFGLPSESIEETMEIVKLVNGISKLGYKKSNISISLTPFIPKPHTTFQFKGQLPLADLLKRAKILQKELSNSGFNVNIYDPKQAHLQTIFSRGDEEIGYAMLSTVKHGKSMGAWRRSVKELKIDEEKYISEFDVIDYPWKFIKVKPF
jgi:radical SAM superfamily enzyme YgiQ (UPF0313 family)